MRMLPIEQDIPQDVFLSSISDSFVDTEGGDHNIDLGVNITEVLEIVEENKNKNQLRRGRGDRRANDNRV